MPVTRALCHFDSCSLLFVSHSDEPTTTRFEDGETTTVKTVSLKGRVPDSAKEVFETSLAEEHNIRFSRSYRESAG